MGDSAMQGDVSGIGDAGPVRIPITVTGAHQRVVNLGYRVVTNFSSC